MVTSGVEFSFNDVMFRQIDGVAMGSPLGPVLANIFVGYCESLIPSSSYPPLYCRFMDDSFAYFSSVSQCDEFLLILNDLHPSLKFTCESEKLSKLPFLDVLVEKSSEGGVVTSVYRKPTFTGLYCLGFVLCYVIQNQSGSESGGSCTSSLFLSEFIGGVGHVTFVVSTRWISGKCY